MTTCHACTRHVFLTVCSCERPLCHYHLFDPDAHADGCTALGLCDACDEWTAGARTCPDCAVTLCPACEPRPLRHDVGCGAVEFAAPTEAA